MALKRSWLAALAIVGVVGVVGTIMVLQNQPSTAALKALELEEVEFRDYMVRHEKQYGSDAEYSYRFKVFRDNAAYARVHNSQNKGFTLGVNKFADLTNEEFKAIYSSPIAVKQSSPCKQGDLSTFELPSSVDWRGKAVTSVKNQGQCGSCWSFSAAEGVEGIMALKTGKLQSLSEQQLMDCSTSFGNKGCDGGSMDAAFAYLLSDQAKGLESFSEYPYTAEDGTCHYNAAEVVATIAGCVDVQSKSEKALMAAVAQQPVSVAVEANQLSWQLYMGGIIQSDCGTQLDHGVLAAGYGEDNGTLYWLVKNSWGTDWGLDGYLKILRNPNSTDGGMCGIALAASYPTKN